MAKPSASKQVASEKALHEVRAILADFGLPPRLLPDEVAGYSFDAASGRFEVRLRERCEVRRAGIPVRYEATISGRIAKGALRELRGVKAKQGLWVPLSSAQLEGDEVAFAAGPIRRRLPVSEFR